MGILVFIGIILFFFFGIVISMTGYCIASLLKKNKAANIFYISGMTLLGILLMMMILISVYRQIFK